MQTKDSGKFEQDRIAEAVAAILRRLREPPFGTETSERNLMSAAADEIERLRASQERLKSAIEFAHAEGFQWPSDPMAEFADAPRKE